MFMYSFMMKMKRSLKSIDDGDASEVIDYWKEEYLLGEDIGDYEEDEYYDREDEDYGDKFDNEDYYDGDEEDYY